MSVEGARFRDRAKECRRLANDARDDFNRESLSRMADELEAEAAAIDAEAAKPEAD